MSRWMTGLVGLCLGLQIDACMNAAVLQAYRDQNDVLRSKFERQRELVKQAAVQIDRCNVMLGAIWPSSRLVTK